MSPPRHVTVPVADLGEKQGIIIPVTESAESWSECVLEDGTRIKIKPVISDIIKIDGEYDDEGNPLYVLTATLVTSVESPRHLKRTQSA